MPEMLSKIKKHGKCSNKRGGAWGMNKDEIMQQIADDVKRTFQENYFKQFKDREDGQQTIKEFAKQYLDSIKERT